MLSWAITFLIIAIVAAVLGFGGIAGTATGIAKILFVVFLVMFIASFFFGRRGRADHEALVEDIDCHAAAGRQRPGVGSQ